MDTGYAHIVSDQGLTAPKNAFPAVRKIRTIVTRFYIGCSGAQTASTHTFVDLLSIYSLARSLDCSSVESVTLPGVGKVLAMEDFELPVLFDKSEDEESFVRERDSGDGGRHIHSLRRGCI